MQSSYGALDGDGDIDIVVGEQDTYPSPLGVLYWLENEGDGGWAKHDLDTGYYWFSTVADIDGDQDPDIIVSKSDVFWLENTLPDTSWTFHLIAEGSPSSNFSNVAGNCADMDNDGDQDVVSAFNANGDLVYYENPDWIKRTIFSQGTVLYVCEFGDPDGDGDLDVPYGGAGGENIPWGWVENPETVWGWSPHPIAPSSTLQQIPNTFADIDGDGDEDLVSL
ncbi:MAG: VCBS repeat-containing protein [Saprospirales bacterium]|nr:VCBS repeat-containing protein [Saprospirales bacterium]